MTATEFISRDSLHSITIANGQITSNAIDLGGSRLVAFQTPNVFDGTTLALQACTTLNGTFAAVRDKAGTAISFAVTAGDFTKVDPTDALGLRFIKLVATTAQSGTDSIINLITSPF